MNKLTLTTRLNIKLVCIVSLLIIVVTGYNHWLTLQEEYGQYTKQLEDITAFLVEKTPPCSFNDIAARQGFAHKPPSEQVLAINKELQPILINMFLQSDEIKFGFYSRQHDRIVAIGPVLDNSLLVGVDPDLFTDVYAANTTKLAEKENSIVWYGAPILYHLRPISQNGNIIGHAFAIANLKTIYAKAWKKTVKTFSGAFIMILVCILLFQETLIRLKKDLNKFAEEIVQGRAAHFKSELTELNPILNYISEQTEKMTRLDRLNIIGEMAASIGHEVRNPMTTVRGFLQFLGKKEQLQPYKNNFDLMIDEIDRANSIITEFLSLAKNRAMDFKENNLNKVISDIFPLLQASVLEHNCKIDLDLKNIPNNVVDERSIRQLIMNMVRNAIEAMPQGGTILISTYYSADKIVLSIKDNGIGITKDLLDKLGTPFFTTKESGTGLGLAVCYRIANRHNAAVLVHSEQGKGTNFSIEFNKTNI